MHLISQRTNYDCGVACIAMATEESYEKVFSLAPHDFLESHGMTDGLAVDILQALGCTKLILDVALLPFRFNQPRMVAVPSLNFDGIMHFVYWDGFNVLDPQTGRTPKIYWPNGETAIQQARSRQLVKEPFSYIAIRKK